MILYPHEGVVIANNLNKRLKFLLIGLVGLNIVSIGNNPRNSINSGLFRLEEIQKQDSSIISEFRYEFGDLKDKTVDIKLLAKPKEIDKVDKFAANLFARPKSGTYKRDDKWNILDNNNFKTLDYESGIED